MSAKSRKSKSRSAQKGKDSSETKRQHPGSDSGVSVEYSGAAEELSALLAALEIEREAEREEFRREWLEYSLARRRALGVTLYPLEFVEANGTLGGRWKLRFRFSDATEASANSTGADSGKNAKARLGRGHRFQSGQLVQLFRAPAEGAKKDASESETLSGVLAEIRQDRLTVIADQEPDWLDQGRVGINLAFNETTYREMERAVRQTLEDKKIASRRDRLLAYSPARSLHFDQATDESTSRLPVAALNGAQARAVAGVAALQPGDFAVIHGPPGTGKTTTVVAAIRTLLERGERVLVTAPTNAAADLLAERLLAADLATFENSGRAVNAPPGDSVRARSRTRLLRLGHPARVSESIARHTLEGSVDAHPDAKTTLRYRAEAEELYRKARKYRRNFGPAERAERAAMLKEHAELRRLIRDMERGIVKHIVDGADVIVTTLVGAASNRLAEQEFDCAVIDEATQALEPAAWIAALRAEKLVMAGDHRQLPPTVKAAAELSNTLFEKTITRHAGANCVFFLDTQYRMRPEIVAFSNREFYEDRLQTDESVLLRHQAAAKAGEALEDEWQSPLVFIDTAGCDFHEELDPDSESYRNPGEARLLATLLENRAAAYRRAGRSIGVIATYREQANHLRDVLAALPENTQPTSAATEDETPLPGLEVDTVDAFQGREHDWICISLVRSNDAGETGFLSETRRLNVALTRARRLLLVVGDSATLANHAFYERFLKYAERHGDYRSAYEFLEIV